MVCPRASLCSWGQIHSLERVRPEPQNGGSWGLGALDSFSSTEVQEVRGPSSSLSSREKRGSSVSLRLMWDRSGPGLLVATWRACFDRVSYKPSLFFKEWSLVVCCNKTVSSNGWLEGKLSGDRGKRNSVEPVQECPNQALQSVSAGSTTGSIWLWE